MEWIVAIAISLALTYLRLVAPVLLKDELKDNQNNSEER